MKKVRYGKLRQVYQGVIFDVHQRDVLFPNGEKKIFEYCRRPNSVTILAFDRRGRLLLINEYRHGFRKNTWFLPAGRVDKGESPTAAAQRELREEAGYKAGTFKRLYRKSPSNSLLWHIDIFAAKDLRPAPLAGDEEFPIKVEFVSLPKAVKMATDGTIENEFIAYNIIRFAYMLRRGQFKW
ncbi:NUDIX hydrolase [Patescibacteria group bacterium]|nr:MAG: NUDIX hydrolase [Patescibacteria group bacterium]